MPDYLSYMPKADQQAVRDLSQELRARLKQNKKGFLRFRRPCEAVAGLKAKYLDFSGEAVVIGCPEELDEADRQLVYRTMREFMPWRKGPFNVFGHKIDAEWRSNRKWDRLAPIMPALEGKIVADIGANNGYYMFKAAAHDPALVLGFEPYIQHYFAFKTLNQMAGLSNLSMEPFGVENIDMFPGCFDVIFLMGIIYHRVSPVEMLRDLIRAMKPGGTLIVESQAIPGEEPVALFPEKRYAKVPGTYFVPTAACLRNWLIRAGFSGVECFCSHPMSDREQRHTEWMTFESYRDFIDPENHSLTVEGYPAPIRVYLKAVK